MTDWLDGAYQVKSPHDGGSMIGGPPRFVWHTYEASPSGLSAVGGAHSLIGAGNEVHFVLHPLTGDLVQILPAHRAARGLVNTAGGVQTNRMGSVCLQVEVIAFAANPWTSYCTPLGWEAVGRLVAFAREHGIPDIWPAGPPPAYPPGNGNRSASIWESRSGHYGHSQVPENTHGDPGAIDTTKLFGAAQAAGIKHIEEDAMAVGRICYHPGDGALWLVSGGRARHIPSMDLAREAAQQQTGQDPSLRADDLPRISGAMVAWLNSGMAVDPAQLADLIVAKLPSGGPSAEQIVEALAAWFKR